jgi:hypothetical protein
MTDKKLLAVNVFDEAKDQNATTTPETKTPEQSTTTPKSEVDNRPPFDETKTVQDAGQDLSKKPADNTFLYGGLIIGFLVLLLVGLVIIKKLNKRK